MISRSRSNPSRLRDQFARAALIGICSHGPSDCTPTELAWDCYRLADAMMKVRAEDREKRIASAEHNENPWTCGQCGQPTKKFHCGGSLKTPLCDSCFAKISI